MVFVKTVNYMSTSLYAANISERLFMTEQADVMSNRTVNRYMTVSIAIWAAFLVSLVTLLTDYHLLFFWASGPRETKDRNDRSHIFYWKVLNIRAKYDKENNMYKT